MLERLSGDPVLPDPKGTAGASDNLRTVCDCGRGCEGADPVAEYAVEDGLATDLRDCDWYCDGEAL